VALYVEFEVPVVGDGTVVPDHISILLVEELELRHAFVDALLQLHEIRAASFLAGMGYSFAVAPGSFEAGRFFGTVRFVVFIGTTGGVTVWMLASKDVVAKGSHAGTVPFGRELDITLDVTLTFCGLLELEDEVLYSGRKGCGATLWEMDREGPVGGLGSTT